MRGCSDTDDPPEKTDAFGRERTEALLPWEAPGVLLRSPADFRGVGSWELPHEVGFELRETKPSSSLGATDDQEISSP